MEKIVGLVIDPRKRNIESKEFNAENLLQELTEIIDCRAVAVVSCEKFDVWIDDEGMFTAENFFALPEFQPVAGRGIILGASLSTGESKSHPLTELEIQKLREETTYYTLREAYKKFVR